MTIDNRGCTEDIGQPLSILERASNFDVMLRRICVALALFSALSTPSATAQNQPLPLEGFVTRAVSFADFDADGLHVLFSRETRVRVGNTFVTDPATSGSPYVGQPVSIVGRQQRGKHQIKAEEIVFLPVPERKVSGFAVIDRVLSPSASKEILVRADGYPILVNASTQITFKTPFASLSQITTNIWIAFHGKLREDGTVLAETAIFTQNIVQDREDKLLAKTDYDPSAVPDDSKQNVARKFFLGVDLKKIPPVHDAAMQARINHIGESLIPRYQRDLPDTDETKIDFRFQLVDQPKWHDAVTTPGGVILVPRHIVERLQNDSQLAAVLADNIGTALEKQTYFAMPKNQAILAANLGGTAAGFFVPGLGLATGIATFSSAKTIYSHQIQQSGRVGLGLLHDAGYDINEAPLAWWTIAAKNTADPTATDPPDRSLNLYRTIGTVWHNYSESPIKPATALQSN
ncbi:hypothetical protein [Tunturiibacter gelidiferens]|uniref:hypothetical protein n=1 Tax=Tunturiibacter gelidiferens TaxID=3069689 RepID=UPI003D9BCD2E